LFRLYLPPNPLPGAEFLSDKNMSMTEVLAELSAQENSRESDLEEARSIQELMLPAEALRTPQVTVAHAFKPAAEVGGDFLDYFSLADETVGVYLGDVCGKGLPAALYAALAVGTLRGVHKTGQSPASVLATLNRRLTIRGIPRRYATMQYALCDPRSGAMQIASAGMSGPLHVSPSGCRELQLSGLPPGMFPNTTYETHALQLQAGDSMVFFSDGIVEARDTSGEFFGMERLVELCGAQGGANSAQLLERIFAAVQSFAYGREQHDDMAIVVFQFTGTPG
jgi:sigma-B regulation protein RsbU (phosphoserine phosphatase)